MAPEFWLNLQSRYDLDERRQNRMVVRQFAFDGFRYDHPIEETSKDFLKADLKESNQRLRRCYPNKPPGSCTFGKWRARSSLQHPAKALAGIHDHREGASGQFPTLALGAWACWNPAHEDSNSPSDHSVPWLGDAGCR
jgi:hypothetical protein